MDAIHLFTDEESRKTHFASQKKRCVTKLAILHEFDMSEGCYSNLTDVP